jgi:hypothetical protein
MPGDPAKKSISIPVINDKISRSHEGISTGRIRINNI